MLNTPDGRLVLSATDLTSHIACAHLTRERRRIALGDRPKPRPAESPHGDLIRERGDAHERSWLAAASAVVGGHVDLSTHETWTVEGIVRAAQATEQAMRDGERLIFQAVLFDGRWQGKADFLRRIDAPSGLGSFAYEVVDTKLARQVKPHVVHQLCLYNRLLARVQGDAVHTAVVVLGDGTEERVDLRRYAALHRHVSRQLEHLADDGAEAVYPEPTAHCVICRLESECEARRRGDDHLSLVANARRDQRARLVDAGIGTVAALGCAAEDTVVADVAPERFSLLHHQARLQVQSRETKLPARRHLEPERARGYARLPAASPGDVFFDLEGDPFVTDGGIEYLWGWTTADGPYECRWAHTVAEEKAAFEAFVDFVEARRRLFPGLHVFHYAPHEVSKLRSLAIAYGTREAEVDGWLRGGVLVDLLAVVRQGMQVGEESYSLKKLERHHGFVRLETSVREGGGSIIAYETWLDTGDDTLLEAIRAYNEEDCRSTQALRDWVLGELRPEAADEFGVDFEDLAEPDPEDTYDGPAWLPDVRALIDRLHAGLPVDPAEDDADAAERRMLGDLLLYHYRETKPQYWSWFELEKKTAPELVDEREAIGLIELDDRVAPVPHKQSLDWRATFPPQETRLAAGDRVVDPATGETHNLVAVEADHLVLRRGKKKEPPRPRALIPATPPDAKPLRQAIVAVAESVLAGDGRFVAARSILRREAPRLLSGELGPSVEQLIGATLGLHRSHLPVQGPPGTGKTYRGARMIVAAMRAGQRVAVTANSHAAVQNLLRAIERHAAEIGFAFAGVYKGAGYDSPAGLIDEVDENRATYDTAAFELVAGTAWLLSADPHAEAFGTVFVDEAGQFSLASAIAVARTARSVVLLGDPQQLPQVNQASHPGGSGASVLEHLLDGSDVVPAGKGVLLDETWRMHPDVCAFVSERSYAGELHAREACGLRRISSSGRLAGVGLRVLSVVHEGCSQESEDEAVAIAAACRELLADGTVRDDAGVARRLVPADILVVAPYNLAVRRVKAHVPDGVRVGTVDRFQGQEAPVVFFAMTCSSGEDVPRGLDFLFDRNRLNVAVSRAQCLAVLVHAPRLLDADCRTLAHMELVDGACRFAELASVVATRPAAR